MFRITKNIKSFIGVFILCERVVTNHLLNIFITSNISNFINKICIYAINFGQSGTILTRTQLNISGINRVSYMLVMTLITKPAMIR